MPKHAAVESEETPRADEKFAALVQNADIIYFPIELSGPASRSGTATRLVHALRRSGGSFTIGWDLIGGEEQELLEHWATLQLSTEALISRLHLSGTARERANCRALLNETKEWGARFLGLRCPAGLLATGRPETTLDASLLAEEFAAERIVGHFRKHRDEKLLIFIHRRQIDGSRGVPHFVAQKIKARQLVFDSEAVRPSHSQLLAWRVWCGLPRRLEIVDGSPRAGGDQF